MRLYQSTVDAKRTPQIGHTKDILFDRYSVVTRQKQDIQAIKADTAGIDDRIYGEVIAELESDPTIDTAAISIHIENGVVTLRSGTNGFGDQRQIESAVIRIAGVTELRIELAAASDPGMRTDEDIRRDCEHRLGLTMPRADYAIRVMVSAGWVTLSGNVALGHERQAAEELVSRLMGVIGVNGQLRVGRLEESENTDYKAVFK